MAAIAILAVACTTGVLFLLRFLVAICGKDGRRSHVVHVLQTSPENDGRGGSETDPDIAFEDVNQDRPHRQRAPLFAANLVGERDRGGWRGFTAMQRKKSPTQGRTSEAGKSIR
jgi:hypothetical protein